MRGKECAIKKLKGQEMSEAALEEMRKEVKIMRCEKFRSFVCLIFTTKKNVFLLFPFFVSSHSELYHPNIVLFMGACFKKGAMAMGNDSSVLFCSSVLVY